MPHMSIHARGCGIVDGGPKTRSLNPEHGSLAWAVDPTTSVSGGSWVRLGTDFW